MSGFGNWCRGAEVQTLTSWPGLEVVRAESQAEDVERNDRHEIESEPRPRRQPQAAECIS